MSLHSRAVLLWSFLAFVVCGGLAWIGLGHWRGTGASDSTSRKLPEEDNRTFLDDRQRTYIWEVEHHVLVLSKHWFRDFSQALEQSDEKSLGEILAQDFQGGILQKPIEEKLDTPFAQVVRQKNAGHAPVPLTPSEFIGFLLGYRKPFRKPPHVKVYPKTMGPRNRDDVDSPWEGTGVLRMWGETKPGKPREVVLHFHFRIPRPHKKDEKEYRKDHWLESMEITQVQSAEAPRYLLRDATRERNIDATKLHDNWNSEKKFPVSGGVYLCDFNRDGIPDMLVVDISGYALYQGLADGKLKDVTTEVGLPGISEWDGNSAAFVDLDGDGWEDLIIGNNIYRNVDGKKFVDYTYRTNLRFPADATGVSICDYDKDGLVDLYVTRPGKGKEKSWLDGHSGDKRGNQLWRNLGNWKFEDVTEKSGASGGSRSVFSAVWLDINNDGWPDLYVPNEFGNGVLLLNNGDGTFRQHALMKGPHDFGTMGITCGDINNDGHIDLYLANMYSKTGSRIVGLVKPGTYSEEIMAKMRRFVSGSNLYLNKGNLTFDSVSPPWQMNDIGWAYGPALVDLDNDGFLDLFATSGFVSVSRDEPDG